MSTITSLKASNVKRLSAVEITPKGEMVVIGGANGNGKSSVLDAIAFALGGKTLVPQKPIRIGETEAKIEVEITTANTVLTATRRFKGPGDGTVTNTTLEVSEKRDGRLAKLQGPQAVLDEMCGTLMFDPLEFTRKKPKEQVAMLKELVGIATDEIDKQEADLFKERTEVNRACKEAEAQWAAAETYPDAPGELVSMGALVEALNEANAHNSEGNELRARAVDAERQLRTANEDEANKFAAVTRLERQLAEAREEHETAKHRATLATNRLADAIKAADEFVLKPIAPIRQQMDNVEETNRKVRANAEERRLKAAHEAAKAKAEALTNQITELRERRTEMMANAKWPVPGMAFDDSGVTLNGLPFSQGSSAEQLRVSVKMSLAANPLLKVAFIRDGSLLDEASMALVAEEVSAAGAQIWLERVGDDDPSAIVIEDGHVRQAVEAAA